VPGHTAGHPALRRLVADPEAFARDVWGAAALLTRSTELPSAFADLFDEAAVDELVSQRGLRTPFIRMAQDGTTLATRDFTSAGGVGAGIADQVDDSKLTALFADGATLVLQALHRTWPPLIEFSQQLAAELGHAVQVNAYVTPPQSRGFDDHYDVHDVFVLQVSGEKRWRIHEPVHEAPLRDQPWTDRREAVAEAADSPPIIDEVLTPGDCLYLPRGSARTSRSGSTPGPDTPSPAPCSIVRSSTWPATSTSARRYLWVSGSPIQPRSHPTSSSSAPGCYRPSGTSRPRMSRRCSPPRPLRPGVRSRSGLWPN
jgi:hypothetical protein